MGKANQQLAAFSLKNLLSLCVVPCHIYTYGITALWALREPGDNMKASDLSTMGPSDQTHASGLSASSLPARPLCRPLCFPLVWFGILSQTLGCCPSNLGWVLPPQLHLPVNTFSDTPRGAAPSSVQSRQVDST